MMIQRFLVFLVLLLAIPFLSLAQEGVDGTVTTSELNVRALPGTSSAILGKYTLGTQVRIEGREDDPASEGVWVLTTPVGGGLRGWILVDYLQLRPDLNVNLMTVIPVVDASTGQTVQQPAPAQEQQQQQAAPQTTTNNPAPVSGGTPIRGFSYGAHIAGFDGTEAMSAIGMSWVKVQIRHNPGANPAEAAGWINDAHGRGFRILLGVVGAPQNVSDSYFQDYAGYVGGLAALGADAIEVWNEPNLDREWPNGQVDPAYYTRLLAVSYNAIKNSNRNTMVISGALAPTGFFGGCSAQGCDDLPYLQGMRNAGAASYMDCVGAHYNEGIVSPRATSGDPRSEYYTRYFYGMVNTYYSAIGKPICFTELG
ncbi:MAG: SH3 domain-containing protein, partial [Anaerolineae bacterium]|nr:SH3 domain-containing protein [Anaerolineae bacterium]